MNIEPTAILSVALGIGLAAATGFRIFLPLLMAAIAARAGWMPMNESFVWLQSTAVLITLGTAAVFEAVAYLVPGVDHALDVLAAPLTFVAGAIASAAAMVDLPPSVLWPVAVIAGGGIAGLTKGSTAVIRAQTGVATAGLGNPVVSSAETILASVVAALAIALPLVCVIAVAALAVWAVRRLMRWRARRQA
jgi:hypothetical protein